jgi:hypothetical protein
MAQANRRLHTESIIRRCRMCSTECTHRISCHSGPSQRTSQLSYVIGYTRDRIHTVANDIPKVYAMLQVDPAPRVVFFHRLTRYAPSLLRPQPWDNRVFGFQGDLLHGNQSNLVEWPATPFARTAMTTVPLIGQMEAAWQANGGGDTLGLYGANEPNMEQLQAWGLSLYLIIMSHYA